VCVCVCVCVCRIRCAYGVHTSPGHAEHQYQPAVFRNFEVVQWCRVTLTWVMMNGVAYIGEWLDALGIAHSVSSLGSKGKEVCTSKGTRSWNLH
jgi:hypothetical protein